MRIRALLFLSCWMACAMAHSSPVEELARARSKWESQRIGNYAFQISNACSCPLLHAGPLVILVEDGKVRRAYYAGTPKDGFSKGQSVRRRTPLRLSIDGLFEMIEKKLKTGNAAYLKIKYDDKLGYPARFEYDDPAHQGDQTKIEIKEFKRLE